MKIVKLKLLVNIRTGTSAKFTDEGGRNAIYLQVKYFDDDFQLKSDDLPESDIFVDTKFERHLIKKEEIAVASKGSRFFSWCNSTELDLLVSSSFFVLDVTSNNVLPQYLTWYLNTPNVLNRFYAMTAGASMPNISRTELENITVPIPSFEKQVLIAKTHETWMKEKAYIHALMEKKGRFYNQILLNSIK